MQIFCPSNHLILNQDSCPQCGWQRPITTVNGKAVWEKLDFDTGLGNKHSVLPTPLVITNNTLILPLKTNELVGIQIQTGDVKWRKVLPVGLQVTGFTNTEQHTFISLQDVRSLTDDNRFGSLYQINPKDGSLSLFWTAPSHSVSPMIVNDHQLMVRSSNNKIFGLAQSNPSQIEWQINTISWIPFPLVNVKNQIFYADGSLLSGKGFIQGFDLFEHKKTWQVNLKNGIPGYPLVSDHEFLFVVDGKKTIKAIEPLTGNVVWEENFLQIYSPPSIRDGILSFAIRGNAALDAPDHYALIGLKTGTWKQIFRIPLPTKTIVAPLLNRDQIFTGGQDGSLRCFDLLTGNQTWAYQLGDQEDAVKTPLTRYENTLVVGTTQGKIALLTIQERDQLEPPHFYMETENWVLAAAAFALQANFKSAAELYLTKIHEISKAVQLYAQGGFLAEAADTAFENGLWTEALGFYQKTENLLGLAKTHLKMGNEQRAAEYYAAAGNPLKAAELMEKIEEYRLAINYYQLAKRAKDAWRLKLKLGIFDTSDLMDLRKQENFQQAAELAMQNRLYEDAARDFQKANLPAQALTALQMAAQNNPNEIWIWEEMAQIAENLNQYEVSGQAWLKLDKPFNAGNAFKLAAELLIQNEPSNIDKITECYEKAIYAYERGGYDEIEDYLACQVKQREIKKLPNLILKIIIPNGSLQEYVWSGLLLEFTNNGYGIAENIRYEIDCERFEIDKKKSSKLFHLDCGVTKKFKIDLRSKTNERGDVPLQIQWLWEKKGECFDRCESKIVNVRKEEEPQVNSQVTIVYGDQVKQKDSVTINRGTQSKDILFHAGEEQHQSGETTIQHKPETGDKTINQEGLPCPECNLINDKDAFYCKECGTKLIKNTFTT